MVMSSGIDIIELPIPWIGKAKWFDFS